VGLILADTKNCAIMLYWISAICIRCSKGWPSVSVFFKSTNFDNDYDSLNIG